MTGLGILAANGNTKESFWKTLLAGESGIGPVTLFDAGGFQCRIAGEVKAFDPHAWIDPALRPERRMARASQFAIAAAIDALRDAALDVATLREEGPVPVVMGVSTTAMDLRERPPRPWSAIAGIPHAVGSAVAFTLGFPARLTTISNGCASGLDAVAFAAAEIRTGKADIALAGSSDAAITPYVFKCFESSRKVSLRNDDPAHASRPFDRGRDGGVAAEGVGVLVLENLEHALARGACPRAEILGHGTCADAPSSPEGSGLEAAMRMALANSAVAPEQVDHVSAHAPSDVHMDRLEVRLIKTVFGSHAYRIPVTSIKGATGNPMAVGGVHQLIAAILALEHGVVPPTTNLETPDPECDLDHVPAEPRAGTLRTALINTHGFGRGNSALVVQSADGTGNAAGMPSAGRGAGPGAST